MTASTDNRQWGGGSIGDDNNDNDDDKDNGSTVDFVDVDVEFFGVLTGEF